MKYLLLAMMLTLALPVPAQADPKGEVCGALAAMGRSIMAARQAGVTIEDAYAIAPDDLTRALVVEAYKQNKWSSKGYQDEAVDTFGNDVFLACMAVKP